MIIHIVSAIKKSASAGNAAPGPSAFDPNPTAFAALDKQPLLCSDILVDIIQTNVSSFQGKLKDAAGTPDLTLDLAGIDQVHMNRDNGSVMDTELLQEHFGRTKLHYEVLCGYVYQHRLELLQAYEEHCQRVDILGCTSDQMQPADRIKKEQWPTTTVCQDLNLTLDKGLDILPGQDSPPVGHSQQPQELSKVDRLKQRIAFLEFRHAIL
ncbi:hypothetical protein [Parasitella parasitica]|uniref:Uncharacterized protein n=1 Tax=Parasitella parasitica TaxID=35722 RepID=A0A0B7NNF2_9FUNG|nr:hypothetical protein [Parasitella parasitica]